MVFAGDSTLCFYCSMYIRIDDIDCRILKVLQRDGRITNRNLADEVALSPSPCLARRKRLEDRGVVRSYQAMVNLGKTASTVTVNAEVTLARNTLGAAQYFEEYVRTRQSIVYAVAVSGTIDYLLTFCVPSLADYQRKSDHMIKETGTEVLTSHVVLGEVKRFEGYPIDLLLSEGPESSGR